MTQKELTENVVKCYNSLPYDCKEAMETLISTNACFILMNVNTEVSTLDEAIRYFMNALINKLKSIES